jgi:hypothetical protein
MLVIYVNDLYFGLSDVSDMSFPVVSFVTDLLYIIAITERMPSPVPRYLVLTTTWAVEAVRSSLG